MRIYISKQFRYKVSFIVTLTSNVDNLKKKLDESLSTCQKATAQLNEQIAKNFDMDGLIASSKAEAAAATKMAEEARAKTKRDDTATLAKVADLEAELSVRP